MLPLPRARRVILSVFLALGFAVAAAARALAAGGAAAAGPAESAVAPVDSAVAPADAPADARAEAMFAAGELPPASPLPVVPQDLLRLRQLRHLQWSPDGRWLVLDVASAVESKNRYTADLYRIDADDLASEPQPLTFGPEDDREPRWSEDGQRIAFLSNRGDTTQVWVMEASGGEAKRLTHAPQGVESYRWLPGRDVIVYTSVDPPSEQEKKRQKEHRDAEEREKDFHFAHLHAVDVQRGESWQLTSGPLHVQDFEMSPDGAAIAFTACRTPLVRDEQETEIYIVPAPGGVPRRLTENRAQENNLGWSPDGKLVTFTMTTTSDWQGAYVGVDHLFAVPPSGGEPAVLSAGWERGVAEASPVLAWSGPMRLEVLLQDGMHAVVSTIDLAYGDGGVYASPPRELLRPDGWLAGYVAVDAGMPAGGASGGDVSPGVRWPGAQPPDFRRARRAFFLEDPTRPPEVFVAESPQALVAARRWSRFNAGLENRAWAEVRPVTWHAGDGAVVEGLLYTPRGAGAPWPLVVMIHGGPLGVERLDFKMGMTRYPHLLAARGYASFLPNYRGSSGYGEAWAREIQGHYYEKDVGDILAGVDSLVGRGIADSTRLATTGWSNGGILSAWIVTQTTRFKAACAGAADVDWISDYGMSELGPTFDRAYFGAPPYADPQHYVDKSPIFRVRRVKTPTLIFHGEQDMNVPPNQGWEFFHLLREVGVPVELVTIPRAGHGVGEIANRLVKVEKEMAWLDRYVLQKKAASPLPGDAPLATPLLERPASDAGYYGRLRVRGILEPETLPLAGDTLRTPSRYVHGFEIGRFEITNAQYACYLRAEARARVPRVAADAQGPATFDAARRWPLPGYENHPVVGLSLAEARAYCAWLSRALGKTYRLPSRDEWELAARGSAGGDFPGGDRAPDANSAERWAGRDLWSAGAFWGGDEAKALLAHRFPSEQVGAHAESGHHLYDMAGNAAEWCLDSRGQGVLRGGSYRSWKADLRLDVVGRGPDPAAGLRVVCGP